MAGALLSTLFPLSVVGVKGCLHRMHNNQIIPITLPHFTGDIRKQSISSTGTIAPINDSVPATHLPFISLTQQSVGTSPALLLHDLKGVWGRGSWPSLRIHPAVHLVSHVGAGDPSVREDPQAQFVRAVHELDGDSQITMCIQGLALEPDWGGRVWVRAYIQVVPTPECWHKPIMQIS